MLECPNCPDPNTIDRAITLFFSVANEDTYPHTALTYFQCRECGWKSNYTNAEHIVQMVWNLENAVKSLGE
jgi:hypothetical protein